MTFFSLSTSIYLGGKLDICGPDDLFFLLFTISGSAGLFFNCAPHLQISEYAPVRGESCESELSGVCFLRPRIQFCFKEQTPTPAPVKVRNPALTPVSHVYKHAFTSFSQFH